MPKRKQPEADQPVEPTRAPSNGLSGLQLTAAVIGIVVGTLIIGGGLMRLGQTQFGYELLSREPPSRSVATPTTRPVTEPEETTGPQTTQTASREATQEAEAETAEVGPRPARGLFEPGNPFPWPFTNFPLGTKMSVILAAFPDADRGSNRDSISIEFSEGPFDHAYYSFTNDRIDPEARYVSFSVSTAGEGVYEPDPEASAEVWREVLGTFRSYDYAESRVDEAIYWDDVNGYRLSLTEFGLQVRPAD